MSPYDVFAISDSEVNVCRMPATRNVRTTKWEVGYLRLHHIRNVECPIRNLSKEFVSLSFNESVVMWNGARCEAFPHHTTGIPVSGIVISKGDGPRGPQPASASDVNICCGRRVVRYSHFHRKTWPQTVRVVLASLGPQFLCILESVENDHVLAHKVYMDDVSCRRRLLSEL